MLLNIKYHLSYILIVLFTILSNCQLQDPDKNHGILFLENRSGKLMVEKSNQNDVVNVIGQPHSKSIGNEDIWIYLERTLSKGKYHKLGRHVTKENNALVLSFNKYGILINKKFYSKEDMQEIAFSKSTTENKLTQKSFVESFLSSVRAKMYRNRK